MQTLPVRSADAPLAGIAALHLSGDIQANGLPALYAHLEQPLARALTVTLRIHNQAGIPIIEAYSQIAVGAATLTFGELNPLGIEAYAHSPPERRLEVAQRVWSRRAYAILRCTPA